ncbi:hypothetical protein Tco_0516514 [Tanacetum coccineum]
MNMTLQSSSKDRILATQKEVVDESVKHQRLSGLLQQPDIPEWKSGKGIAMDFWTKLPMTSSEARQRSGSHVLYLNEIVARHGVPISIICDRDSRFTYSVRCAPFEELYGRKCHSPFLWAEIREGHLIGPELVQETTEKISQIKDRLKSCARSHEMQKLETELWNHVMVGAGHAAYTDRFHELARLVPHLVTPESRKIERYVYGFALQIRDPGQIPLGRGILFGVGMGFEIVASDVREDDEEFEAEASSADTRETVVDPLAIGDSFETSKGASLVERIGSLRLEYLKVQAMLSIERDQINSLRWHMALSQEEFLQVRRDRDDTRRRLRRLESNQELINRCVEEALAAHEQPMPANTIEAENSKPEKAAMAIMENGGNGTPNEMVEVDRPVAKKATYPHIKSINHHFKGTEGVVGLIRWFEKMETVFHISNCPEKYQVKYATCTLLNMRITWWERDT